MPAAPVPAWAPLASSGPTNLQPVQSEISRLQVDATEGTFTLSARTFLAKGTVASLGVHTSAVVIEEEEGAFAAGQEIRGEYFAPGTTITVVIGNFRVLSQPTTNSSTASNVKVEGSKARQHDRSAPLRRRTLDGRKRTERPERDRRRGGERLGQRRPRRRRSRTAVLHQLRRQRRGVNLPAEPL